MPTSCSMTPARQENFKWFRKEICFRIPFCSTRRIEDEPVPRRADDLRSYGLTFKLISEMLKISLVLKDPNANHTISWCLELTTNYSCEVDILQENCKRTESLLDDTSDRWSCFAFHVSRFESSVEKSVRPYQSTWNIEEYYQVLNFPWIPFVANWPKVENWSIFPTQRNSKSYRTVCRKCQFLSEVGRLPTAKTIQEKDVLKIN